MVRPQFHVAIVGGRDFSNRYLLYIECDRLLRSKLITHEVIVVCGTASGADTLGEDWARYRGLSVESFKPDWSKHGKAAGMKRNAEMCTRSDAVIAFWDGETRGTKQMLALSQKRGKMVRIIKY